MEILIEYCGTCNYRPIAASLAMAIERELKVKPELVHSTVTGAFEIKVGGKLVFSKRETGRFPDHLEIIGTLKHL